MAGKLELSAILELVDKISAPLKSVQTQAQKSVKDFHKVRDAVRSIEKQQNKISGFRKLQTNLAHTSSKLGTAKTKLRELEQQLKRTDSPTKTLQNNLNKARQRVGRLTDSFEDQERALEKLKGDLRGAGVNVKDLATHEQRLKKSLMGANRQLDKQREKMAKLRKARAQAESIKSARNKAAGFAVAGGVAAAIPIKAFADAEDAATSLKVAMMDSTGQVPKEFKKINALAVKLGNRLPGTTADFQVMMQNLVQEGILFKDILNGTGEAAANLAVTMKMPFDETARFVAKLQDSTRTDAKDMMAFMDQIQKAYYTGADSDFMLGAYSKSSAALDAMRLEGIAAVKTLNPLFALLNQKGMTDGGSVGNAWRKIVSRSLATDKLDKAFAKHRKKWGQDIGLTFHDENGNFAGLDNFFKQMQKIKALGADERGSILRDMFGDNAEVQTVLSHLTNAGIDGYEGMVQKMERQANLNQRVNAQLSTFKNILDAATGTFTNALVAFIQPIAPDLKALVDWFGKISEKVAIWAAENPKLAGTLTRIVGLVVVGLGVFAALSTVFLALIGPIALLKASLTTLGLAKFLMPFSLLKSAVFGFGKAFMWLGRLMLLNPIGLAITAIIAVGYLLIKNWDAIKQKAQHIWGFIKFVFNKGIAWFKSLSLRDIGVSLMQGLADGLKSAALAPVRAVMWVAKKVKSAFTSAKAMDINSPSRVFAGYGDDTMQGLANGILGNQSPVKAIMANSRNMLAAGGTSGISFDNRQPIASGIGGGNGISNQNEFHFHIAAAPGQSERDIANMVAQKVAEVMRSGGSGGALYDYAEDFG